MKTVKSLLLGAAASFIAVAGAQAADLPGRVAPAAYVKICDAYGAGFFYIPGTDTCLKIGGYVRAEYGWNETFNNANRQTSFRSRIYMTFDARSDTEWGLLRSYIALKVTQSTGNQVSALADTANGVAIDRGFIQVGGLTAGFVYSFFDFIAPEGYYWNTTNTPGIIGSDRVTTLLAYTAQFGNGVTATISMEDADHRRFNGAWENVIGYTGNFRYLGTQVPDFVANVRVEQAWGAAQISGAIHQLRGSEFVGGVPLNNISSTYGWAVQAGLKINLPMLAPGDALFLQASYSKGAIDYGLSNFTGTGGDFFTSATGYFGGSGLTASVLRDVDCNAGPVCEKTRVWTIAGQFRHFWTPSLRTALYGGYADIDQGDLGASSFRLWQIGGNTLWSPVKNLDLGVEVLYTNVRNKTIDTSADVWGFRARVQRNF